MSSTECILDDLQLEHPTGHGPGFTFNLAHLPGPGQQPLLKPQVHNTQLLLTGRGVCTASTAVATQRPAAGAEKQRTT